MTHHEEEREHEPRKKAMKLVIAHFNPGELKDMDEMQGKRTHVPGSDVPHYKGIERMIEKFPEIEDHIMKAFERHATGGSVGEMARHAENMRHKGRFGDTKMAFIGPNTKRIFDRIVGDMTGNHRENKNPHTGHPEYYGLSNFLGSVKHGFNSFGKTMNRKVMPALAGVGTQLGHLGNEALSHIKQAAPGAIQGGLQGFMMGGPEGALAGAAEGGGQGLMNSFMNPNNKGAMSQFAQSGLGQNMMGSLPAAYDRYNQGQGWQDNLASTARQSTQGLNNPYAQGVHQAAGNYQQHGGDLGKTFAGGVHGFTQGSENPYAQAANTAANRYQQGGGMPQSMAEGAHAGLRQGFNNMMGRYGGRPMPMGQ